jgi:hypothetical protein
MEASVVSKSPSNPNVTIRLRAGMLLVYIDTGESLEVEHVTFGQTQDVILASAGTLT